MGRIRTRWVKNLAKELVAKHPDKFNEDFENNKKVLAELKIVEEKSVRNKISGYIVRIIRKEKI